MVVIVLIRSADSGAADCDLQLAGERWLEKALFLGLGFSFQMHFGAGFGFPTVLRSRTPCRQDAWIVLASVDIAFGYCSINGKEFSLT